MKTRITAAAALALLLFPGVGTADLYCVCSAHIFGTSSPMTCPNCNRLVTSTTPLQWGNGGFVLGIDLGLTIQAGNGSVLVTDVRPNSPSDGKISKLDRITGMAFKDDQGVRHKFTISSDADINQVKLRAGANRKVAFRLLDQNGAEKYRLVTFVTKNLGATAQTRTQMREMHIVMQTVTASQGEDYFSGDSVLENSGQAGSNSEAEGLFQN